MAEVPFAWIVYPREQTLEAFRLTDGAQWIRVAAFEGSEAARAVPFEELEIPLADLWIEPAGDAG